MLVILSYLLVGSMVGVLAGLLGVGGGVVIVPALTMVFTFQGLPEEYIHHMALGTSLATIVFTSFSSIRAHHKRGAVIWTIVFRIAPGILIGTFSGAWIASQLSSYFLKVFFMFFLIYSAVHILIGIKPEATRDLPGGFWVSGVGVIIGVLSSFVGIGGGVMSVAFMTWCNVNMHKAVGTSSAIGFPLAVSGAAGYILSGLSVTGLPGDALGFVHLTALAGISSASILTAPIGARLAHSLPVNALKRVFACFLIVIAARMAWGFL
ncbi:MAG TPA: sulfite exporter TauE/SafE family protein [Spirochaetota bacterium]|nr:sulfite exporter TauE/SafE family protein [Spirochaetota bacterium]HPJ34948.1 sulfite exporter TauE/SafE family protein [Spirochaetota bacterium]